MGAAGRPGGLAFNVENARFSDAQGGGCGSAGLHYTVALEVGMASFRENISKGKECRLCSATSLQVGLFTCLKVFVYLHGIDFYGVGEPLG